MCGVGCMLLCFILNPFLELDAAQMSTPDFNVHNSHATLSDFTPTTNDEVQ